MRRPFMILEYIPSVVAILSVSIFRIGGRRDVLMAVSAVRPPSIHCSSNARACSSPSYQQSTHRRKSDVLTSPTSRPSGISSPRDR